MDESDVKAFYDDFLQSKMLDYRISGNLRIDKAVERIQGYVNTDSYVLDVGCGIGISAERIAKEVEDGHVWAFDISEQNIWYARKTINESNVTFFAANVIGDQLFIQEYLTKDIDVVTLGDVIEHLPKDEHADLFRFFRSIMSDQSYVVLTYPSPQYQRYLKIHNPSELQIIDQVIELDELLQAARPAGFSLKRYSLETMWRRNQYVHCVLQTDSSLEKVHSEPSSLIRKVLDRSAAIWKHKVVYPFRRWKYVDSIFS